jgi:hypothetical protein
MKTLTYLISALLLTTPALAKPDITWDDPNPTTANVVAYIVYEKVVSGTTVTWKPIWRVTTGKTFNLPAKTVTTTYAVTAINNLGVESKKSNELTIQAPEALQNLRVQTP